MHSRLSFRQLITPIFLLLTVTTATGFGRGDGPLTTNSGDGEEYWSPAMRTVISPINGDSVLLLRESETETEAEYKVAPHIRHPNHQMCDLYPATCTLQR